MKKIMASLIIIGTLLFSSGCLSLHVCTTPDEVLDGIARGYTVSVAAERDPIEGEDLDAYLKANRELWEELAKFYGLIEE
jgi:hypothetical protein